MSRGLALAALLLSLSGRGMAADALSERERAVHAAMRLRGEAEREREAKRTEAAALADEIARLKGGRSGVRAEAGLEDRLRAFDRLAGVLDTLDRKVEAAVTAVDRAQREFAAAADAEAKRLSGLPPHEQAAGLAALEEARDRVRAATEPPAFRPPLDVRRAPDDGPAEIDGKLALLEAERRRLAEELARLEAEDLVLGERLAGKRRWAEALGVSRRDVAAPLLEREAQEIRRSLARLTREREELARARARRREALHTVETMEQEIAAR